MPFCFILLPALDEILYFRYTKKSGIYMFKKLNAKYISLIKQKQTEMESGSPPYGS